VIILEGPDGAGKTTLAHRLSEDLGLPIAPKVVGSDTVPLVNIRQWVNDNLQAGFQRTIFDRHRLISEPIYATAMGGDREDHFWDWDWLSAAMRVFREIGPIVVWCLPLDFHFVNRNVLNDDNNRTVWLHIEKLYRGYMNAAAQGTYDGEALYDPMKTDYAALLRHVQSQLNLRAGFKKP
jgi:hypothetical protein